MTGTCHQGANRILLTTRKRVKMAGGYNLSSFFFKTFGEDESWRQCMKDCKL